MSNAYLIRTATFVSVAALLLGVGWMGTHTDDAQITPEMVSVSGAQAEPAMYFPAGYEIQANAAEPEVYEYY
jgi:hypothetical protein